MKPFLIKFLLAISLSTTSMTAAEAAEIFVPSDQKYLEVSLQCPDGDQPLVLIAKNKKGNTQRTTVLYLSGTAARISVELLRPRGGSFEMLQNIDLSREADPLRKAYGQVVAKRGDSLKAICEGPSDKRDEYFATLKANRRLLGLQ
jgi:hypothetical protein